MRNEENFYIYDDFTWNLFINMVFFSNKYRIIVLSGEIQVIFEKLLVKKTNFV